MNPQQSSFFPSSEPDAPAPAGSADHDTHQVALAMALLWTDRTLVDAYHLLRLLGFKNRLGKNFTQIEVKAAVETLDRRGQLVESAQRPGYRHLADALRVPLYRELLAAIDATELRKALATLDRIDEATLRYSWPTYSTSAAAGFIRIVMLGGATAEEVDRYQRLIARALDWDDVLKAAFIDGFDAEVFCRITPAWRGNIAYYAATNFAHAWRIDLLPIVEWAFAQLDEDAAALPALLRLALADIAIARDEPLRMEKALAGIDGGAADALRAARLASAGEWEPARSAFAAACKRVAAESGIRKRMFPDSLSWWYAYALLAGSEAKPLSAAAKFCAGEAGKRDPSPHDPWGRWVHAAHVRSGETAIERSAFALAPNRHRPCYVHDLWRVLLAAWLGRDAVGLAGEKGDPRQAEWKQLIGQMRAQLTATRLTKLLHLLDSAEAVLDGRDPAPGFFVSGAAEAWRDVLAALQSLGTASAAADNAAEESRLVWTIRLGKGGSLDDIGVLEQKRGPRGWSKPKPASLGKIAGNDRLPPWDAKLARAIRPDRNHAKRFLLDKTAAVVALVGHPAVVLDGQAEQMIDLVEGTPELEVVREGKGDGSRYRMRVTPPLRPVEEDEGRYYIDAEEKKEADALRLITLVQDSPQRLRLVRFTAAQRRAAQLVGGRFSVPVAAQAEVDKALQALSCHFQVHADASQAAKQVAAESRLRAELAPAGEDLALRLVVAPLGGDGPRLTPASGRVRLLAAIAGVSTGTERDLAAERAHLDAALDALPMLDGAAEGCEWRVQDPEAALQLIEVLPTLPAIAAVEWPKGKRVRVVTVDAAQLGVKVTREHDWFRVSGQAAVDESLVLKLEELLAAASAKSRFVAIGDGVYAALTRQLKQKLADLAAVVERDKQGAKVANVAAAWLDDILDGTTLDAAADFRAAIDRLRAAEAIVPRLPKTLQAELRPYQEEGYQWAIRLAAAGFGGCLADDMGLGKTLQALGVLLERAAAGPALVIAPTSVCGNWLAEAGRFAPSLKVRVYADGADDERDRWVGEAAAHDVLIVSYTLLLLAQERFAAKSWHTVVADEAQAIKNAAAKRSQAVFDLKADFRLALSGTPVENRLAELWSIMRFVNPGLLGSLSRFNERFAGPIERNRDREAQHVLKRLVGPFVLRRTKAQVLQDLPPRTELVLSIAPEAPEAAHYEALRRLAIDETRQLAEQGSNGPARFNILAQLTKLRRAACDPRLTSAEFGKSGIVGAKVQAFAELAAELTANGHKTLVFSQFVDFLSLLRTPLDAAGVPYQYLDGSTPAAERNRRVAAFQAGEGDFFLISLKAGGFGLNLTAADYVVITDPWWNPAAEDQAMGRAHRIGQQRPVTVYRLVTKGTVEEQIVSLHHEKRALADSILAEGEVAALPSTDDLVALIRGE